MNCELTPVTIRIMADEIWKPVLNYEGLYSVSNLGRIYSERRNVILKPEISDCGYLRIRFKKNGSQRRFRVHRVVAFAFLENPEDKPYVNHKNHNKIDNRLCNLEWVTPSENTKAWHEYKKSLGIKPVYL